MKKLLLLLFLLANSYFCNAQRSSKKTKQAIIKDPYTYTYIVDGNDSIRCKRTPKEELDKLPIHEYGCVLQLERYLDQFRECLNISDKKSNCLPDWADMAHKQIDQNIACVKEGNMDANDYENELKYYVRFQNKQIEKANKLRDSINVVNNKQKRINDSIAEIERKKNIKSQHEQYISNLCQDIEYRKDEFTGMKHFISPMMEPICFEKEITDKGSIGFVLWLSAPAVSPNIGEGVTILFTDGTKYYKNTKVDSRVSYKSDSFYNY